jgi:uncharacterized BrkB/YihY/UPF0761 family membrane protein
MSELGPGPDGPVDPGRSLPDRVRAGRARLGTEAERARRTLEEARPRSAAVDAVWRAVEHDSATGGPVLAGAVAFRVFLFLVPYVFVIVMVLGFSPGEGASSQDLARRAGIGGLTASAVQGTAELSLFERLLAVVVGSFALLLATRTALKVLRIVHSLVWGVRPEKRSQLLPMLGALGIVTVAISGGLLISRVVGGSLLLGAVAMGLSVVVPAGLWLLASLHLPHGDAPWWALLPGAVIVGVGIEVLHFVTVYWIAREVGNKSDLYGTIGTALALLLWSYLLGRLITVAAVVNATLWRRQQQRQTSAPGAPG